MQAETKFKTKVLKELDKRKPKLWYTKIQQLAKRGDPDLILCVNSLFIAWELKVGKNVASDLQDYTLKKICEAGGATAVVYPQDLHIHLAVIDELLKVEINIGS